MVWEWFVGVGGREGWVQMRVREVDWWLLLRGCLGLLVLMLVLVLVLCVLARRCPVEIVSSAYGFIGSGVPF